MRHPDFPLADPSVRQAMPAPWQAQLHLRFAPRGERTALVERRHRGPLVVQKPLYPEGGICHAVVIHPPAGIAGGDTLDIAVAVEAGAHAVLATPGATKWYKSLGRRADQHVRLEVGEGARLDWLPQENIVFDDARAGIATSVTVAPGGSAIGWDAVVLGRQASGERWSSGTVWMDTRVSGGGRSLWIEQARLDADSPLRMSAVGMDGLPVLGTLWAVGANATQALAEEVAAMLPYSAGAVGLSGDSPHPHPSPASGRGEQTVGVGNAAGVLPSPAEQTVGVGDAAGVLPSPAEQTVGVGNAAGVLPSPASGRGAGVRAVSASPRASVPPLLRAGITHLPHPDQPMLLLRVLGEHIEPVRHLLIDVWSRLREPVHGVPARPLRLWNT